MNSGMTSGRGSGRVQSGRWTFRQRTPYFCPGPEHGISTTVELTVFVTPNFGPDMPGPSLSISGESIGGGRHTLGSGNRGGNKSTVQRMPPSTTRPMAAIAGRLCGTAQCTIRSRTPPPTPAMGATVDRMSFSRSPDGVAAWTRVGPKLLIWGSQGSIQDGRQTPDFALKTGQKSIGCHWR
jgi:hypothetical protein